MFAAYERNKRLYIAAGILLSAAIIVVGLVMRRQARSIFDSRQTLAATLDNMSQGIAMIRADGTIPVVNRRAIELLGLPADLMANSPKFQDVVDWQRAHNQRAHNEFGNEATLDPTLARLLREPGPARKSFFYERRRPNGIILEVRSQVLADGATVCTYTDITERKKT
ncbi:MAG: PAS domain-containing protein, partial [Rhodopila sp.]